MNKLSNVTRNDVKQYAHQIKILYGNAQELLRPLRPIGSNVGMYGRNYDLYVYDTDTCITTGYRPIGNICDYAITDRYEKMANDITEKYHSSWNLRDEEAAERWELLDAYIAEMIATRD